jgi:hypothetical protein
MNTPHSQPPPPPPQGGKGFLYPRHCEHSEATQGAGTDLCGCSLGLLRRDAPRNDGKDEVFLTLTPGLSEPEESEQNQNAKTFY